MGNKKTRCCGASTPLLTVEIEDFTL